MFTLKFMNISDTEESYASFQVPHYFVCKLPNGINEVVLYKDFTSVDGVCYRVSSQRGSEPEEKYVNFQCCYVENSSGKTIDHIS